MTNGCAAACCGGAEAKGALVGLTSWPLTDDGEMPDVDAGGLAEGEPTEVCVPPDESRSPNVGIGANAAWGRRADTDCEGGMTGLGGMGGATPGWARGGCPG